jgi:Methyltransferase domain
MQIVLDYPVTPTPRWGHGKPPHALLYDIINRGRKRYEERLRAIRSLTPALAAIAVEPVPDWPEQPAWRNPWFSGLDLAALYAFIAAERPTRYVEIGSGWTTKVARRAATDHDVPLHITSIDPNPRAEIDRICDEVVRSPVEAVDLQMFSRLQYGDVLFVDNSHRVFTNSDCVVTLLEVLPGLARGVFVHLHDIFLPYDYPVEWSDRYYSEQYLLAAWLLADGGALEIELPNMFVSLDEELASVLAPLWTGPLANIQRHGGSFWLRTQPR